jgi:hypothetical protein
MCGSSLRGSREVSSSTWGRTPRVRSVPTANPWRAFYNLYLIHFPLMLFILGALYATGRFDSIARG